MTRAGLFLELLGPEIAVHEVDVYAADLADLLPEEAAQMSGAHPDRLREFRAGRHCARRAMAELGVPAAPILRARDRSPIFPDGIVGSITHSRVEGRGFCAAAVGRAGSVRGLGIDVEAAAPLEERLWPKVLRRAENAWVLSHADAGAAAKVVFSAKEATYKCQYGITRQFLGWKDVEVAFDETAGVFSATLVVAAPPFPAGYVFQGRVARLGEWLGTGVVC